MDAKNPNCAYGRWDCMPCTHCDAYMPTPTNADRIRSATDEALADHIHELYVRTEDAGDLSKLFCDEKANCTDAAGNILCNDEREKACILRWLRRPAKENDHAELDPNT